MLDFGCLEHVFDFPTAWRNCIDLCRVGGHVLHSLPANNLAGHGFYQFSPELFFNLYREQNGFALRGLWFALKADPAHWWRVADPSAVQRRVTLRNAHEVYMLVVAQKVAEVGPLPAPQQSDYAESEWVKPGRATPGRRAGRSGAARALGARPARRRACRRERLRAFGASGLALPAPDYQRVVVADLLRRGRPAMKRDDRRPRIAAPMCSCCAKASPSPAASSASSASSATRWRRAA